MNKNETMILYCENCGFYLGEYFKENNSIYRFGIRYELKNYKIKCGECGFENDLKKKLKEIKEDDFYYEEKINLETYRFYYDEDLGEVEIHCIYSSGDRDSISIPIEALNNFMKKLKEV